MRKLIKIFLFVLCIAVVMCIVSGCSDTKNTEQNNNYVSDTNVTENNNDNAELKTSENENVTAENAENETDNAKDTDSQNNSKVLVAYFSATGTTKKVAETISNVLSADIYEIVPKEPYTDDDLNYSNNNSRTSIEMNDNSSRPEISGSLENIGNYDVIFLGYPIWWGEAPHIIYTFMESYDFSSKTIIPFCTSGSSGIGSSAENLHSSVSDGGIWIDGDRLESNSSREDIEKWIDGLGLGVIQ